MGFEELLNFATNNLFAIFVACFLLYDKSKTGAEQNQILTELKVSIQNLTEIVKMMSKGGGDNE